jgi:hypothetical protein
MVTESQQLINGVLMLASASTGPAVSEREFLESAIDFANSPTLKGPFLHVPGLKLPKRLMEESSERGLTVALGVNDPALLEQRDQFREDLAAIIEAGTDSLAPSTATRLKQDAARMVLVPRYTFESRRMQVRFHYLPEDLKAVLAYVILILRDESKRFKTEFARCQFKRCGKFFFISDVVSQGRRRKSYCCEEHMAEQHRETGADRVRRHRERVAAKRADHAKRRR